MPYIASPYKLLNCYMTQTCHRFHGLSLSLNLLSLKLEIIITSFVRFFLWEFEKEKCYTHTHTTLFCLLRWFDSFSYYNILLCKYHFSNALSPFLTWNLLNGRRLIILISKCYTVPSQCIEVSICLINICRINEWKSKFFFKISWSGKKKETESYIIFNIF